MVLAPSVQSAKQKVIRKITGRIRQSLLPTLFVSFPFMTSSCCSAIKACRTLRSFSLLSCFLAALPLFPPAGWRGARRRSDCHLRLASAAVLVFWLMASPPATRSGPPTGVLTGVPERRPCSNRPSEIRYGRLPGLRCAAAVATGGGSSGSSVAATPPEALLF